MEQNEKALEVKQGEDLQDEQVAESQPKQPQKHYPTREEILKARTCKTKDIYVEEFGGWIRIRELTADDRDRYDMFLFEKGQAKSLEERCGMRAYLVWLCTVDPKGRRMFLYNDLKQLGKKSYSALGKLYKAAQDISGLGPRGVEAAKEDFVKGQSDDSFSD